MAGPTQVALKLQTLAGLQDEERYVLWVYSPNSFGYRGLSWYNLFVFTMWHLKRCVLSVNWIWRVWIKAMFLVGWQGILFSRLEHHSKPKAPCVCWEVNQSTHIYVASSQVLMLTLPIGLLGHTFCLLPGVCQYNSQDPQTVSMVEWVHWPSSLVGTSTPKLGPSNDPKQGFLKWFVTTCEP